MAKKKVTKKNNPKWVAKKYGFKSGLEENISQQIGDKGIEVLYETEKVLLPLMIYENYHKSMYARNIVDKNNILLKKENFYGSSIDRNKFTYNKISHLTYSFLRHHILSIALYP